MRRASAVVAVATVAGVAWMGFAPTSVGLSNGVGALECRAVLAPIENESLTDHLSFQQDEVAEAWLLDVGTLEEGEGLDVAEAAEVAANVRALCNESQATRSTWMVLTAVFGMALAFALGRRPEEIVTDETTPGEPGSGETGSDTAGSGETRSDAAGAGETRSDAAAAPLPDKPVQDTPPPSKPVQDTPATDKEADRG